MACRNLCDRLSPKIIVGKSNFAAGKKYCRRCEVYLYHDGVFCPCCGMALRATPSARRDKVKLRQNQHLRVLSQRLINEERVTMTIDKRLSILLKDAIHWDRRGTNVAGVFLLKLPSSKTRQAAMVIEIKPINATGLLTRKGYSDYVCLQAKRYKPSSYKSKVT
jgi:hypothetical protein